VTSRLISRQRLKYAHATIEGVLEEEFSMWPAPCPVLGNGPIDTHSDNRRSVLCVVRAATIRESAVGRRQPREVSS
jgi:hypothetical protein